MLLRHICHAGFTLVEMLITVSVLVILLMVGIPSFQGLMRQSDRTRTTMEFAAALAVARSEASRRSLPVSICASSDGATCSAASNRDWSRGWLVFVDLNANGRLDNSDRLLSVTELPSRRYSLTADERVRAAITLRSDGFINNKARAGSLIYRDDAGTLEIQVLPVGRAELSAAGQGADANAS